MYSLNEIILSGCWKLEETTQDTSCRMNMMGATAVKQENTQPVFSAIDHQPVPLPMPMPPPSNFHADLLRSISSNRGSLPPGTYEEFEDPPLEMSTWAQVGEQAVEQFPWNRNAQMPMYPMGTEVRGPSNKGIYTNTV